jgi:hypothetical protein
LLGEVPSGGLEPPVVTRSLDGALPPRPPEELEPPEPAELVGAADAGVVDEEDTDDVGADAAFVVAPDAAAGAASVTTTGRPAEPGARSRPDAASAVPVAAAVTRIAAAIIAIRLPPVIVRLPLDPPGPHGTGTEIGTGARRAGSPPNAAR